MPHGAGVKARVEAKEESSHVCAMLVVARANKEVDMATMGHEKMRGAKPYGVLALMAVLSFIAMYLLMYAMVDALENVYSNLNEFYMAGLMTAPMVIIEIVLMRRMYPRARWNVAIGIASVALLIACWAGIRLQAGVSDRQFLRSMIPHHAGAILMCRQANLHDARILKLCRQIIESQQTEIDQMKAILASLPS
jgi:hypothetical protein